MYNKNLIPAERQMRNLLEQLSKAKVTVLSARLNMDYKASRPYPFRFHIQAWEDSNFLVWASGYLRTVDERETTVPFGHGEVFTLHHD